MTSEESINVMTSEELIKELSGLIDQGAKSNVMTFDEMIAVFKCAVHTMTVLQKVFDLK